MLVYQSVIQMKMGDIQMKIWENQWKASINGKNELNSMAMTQESIDWLEVPTI